MASSARLGIARGNRFENRPMRLVGADILARRESGLALLAQPFGERGVDRGEDRIARNDREHIVECDVGQHEALKIADRLAVRFERRFEISPAPRSVAFSAAWRARPTSKNRRAFWKFCTPPGAAIMCARGAGQRVDDELRRRLGDARPLAGADLHQPHLAQDGTAPRGLPAGRRRNGASARVLRGAVRSRQTRPRGSSVPDDRRRPRRACAV